MDLQQLIMHAADFHGAVGTSLVVGAARPGNFRAPASWCHYWTGRPKYSSTYLCIFWSCMDGAALGS
jgi:hypothetical protein